MIVLVFAHVPVFFPVLAFEAGLGLGPSPSPGLVPFLFPCPGLDFSPGLES